MRKRKRKSWVYFFTRQQSNVTLFPRPPVREWRTQQVDNVCTLATLGALSFDADQAHRAERYIT